MFYPWVPSGDNPADMPSRRYETKSKPQVTEELPASEPPLSLLHVGQQLDDAFYFIHSCSGPRRPGDVLDCIERSSAEIGINIVGIAIDPLAAVSLPEMGHVSHADLLSPHWLDWLVHLIHSGRVLGGMGSPPCSTISAARHVPMKGRDGSSRHRRRGPRPLRSRSDPWVPVPYCDHKDVHAVNIGSPFLLVLGLLGEICNYGGWSALEHPADRQREPYASFFATIEVQFFSDSLDGDTRLFTSACMGHCPKSPQDFCFQTCVPLLGSCAPMLKNIHGSWELMRMGSVALLLQQSILWVCVKLWLRVL